MYKLTGIKAFEAHWQSLQATHLIAPQDSHLLMQAIGRVVDNYGSQSEISAELPLPLQELFNLLVQSYLEGYWIEDLGSLSVASHASTHPATTRAFSFQRLSPAMIAATQRRQRQTLRPTASSEAETYIMHNAFPEQALC
ncbi:hypothetical protein [cf. Phormidesmis sp. LEGE 11477]|uniref:hypothetical protein n=1 Tax=cf. Phormidesmis sp. LEGE 11477 TaxID=1828680 RepID=UPI001882B4E8|nr:hypothetical protein [cf. Phormidesmis sp. LEGE 11477]MBE9062647.1 hypothetical protein [cf. Phormidesmis sp. LEGE 11477]